MSRVSRRRKDSYVEPDRTITVWDFTAGSSRPRREDFCPDDLGDTTEFWVTVKEEMGLDSKHVGSFRAFGWHMKQQDQSFQPWKEIGNPFHSPDGSVSAPKDQKGWKAVRARGKDIDWSTSHYVLVLLNDTGDFPVAPPLVKPKPSATSDVSSDEETEEEEEHAEKESFGCSMGMDKEQKFKKKLKAKNLRVHEAQGAQQLSTVKVAFMNPLDTASDKFKATEFICLAFSREKKGAEWQTEAVLDLSEGSMLRVTLGRPAQATQVTIAMLPQHKKNECYAYSTPLLKVGGSDATGMVKVKREKRAEPEAAGGKGRKCQREEKKGSKKQRGRPGKIVSDASDASNAVAHSVNIKCEGQILVLRSAHQRAEADENKFGFATGQLHAGITEICVAENAKRAEDGRYLCQAAVHSKGSSNNVLAGILNCCQTLLCQRCMKFVANDPGPRCSFCGAKKPQNKAELGTWIDNNVILPPGFGLGDDAPSS